MRPVTWFDALHQCQQQGKAYVLVTLLAAAGSTPRASGTKMLVVEDQSFDTIGGGHLEFEATKQARTFLAEGKQLQHVQHYPLSSKLGQCCGGAVNILFEVMIEHCQHFLLFGAGHVAQALVPILAQLPLQIRWVDEREDCFPESMPSNVKKVVTDSPLEEMENAPNNSWAVIMTHNHQLDFTLIEAGLKRNQLGYLGMIGSDTKARRFRTRLAHKGVKQAQIDSMVSPIGLLDVPGKKPIEVAVSIAAQIIQLLHKNDAVEDSQAKKQAWQRNKQLTQVL